MNYDTFAESGLWCEKLLPDRQEGGGTIFDLGGLIKGKAYWSGPLRVQIGPTRTSSTILAKQYQCTDRHGYLMIPVFAP
jgi:hypothetical protein